MSYIGSQIGLMKSGMKLSPAQQKAMENREKAKKAEAEKPVVNNLKEMREMLAKEKASGSAPKAAPKPEAPENHWLQDSIYEKNPVKFRDMFEHYHKYPDSELSEMTQDQVNRDFRPKGMISGEVNLTKYIGIDFEPYERFGFFARTKEMPKKYSAPAPAPKAAPAPAPKAAPAPAPAPAAKAKPGRKAKYVPRITIEASDLALFPEDAKKHREYEAFRKTYTIPEHYKTKEGGFDHRKKRDKYTDADRKYLMGADYSAAFRAHLYAKQQKEEEEYYKNH